MHADPRQFDPTVPIERASTPPASWYIDPLFLGLERDRVFRRSWQPAGRLEQLAHTGDYASGHLTGEPYVVLRDTKGDLRAFFNVCRHHASCIVQGQGNVKQLVCPYHGWTYDLDGGLRKAPHLGGVRDFDRRQFGLVPMDVASWGPLVFVRPAADGPSLEELLEPLGGRIEFGELQFAKRVQYEVQCNWKVFVDNYLDGGYHVGHLHGGLASQLALDSYRTEIADRVSIQTCEAGSAERTDDGVDFAERLAGGAVYAFIYPNFMINRYGPMMDTNWVLPLGHDRTLTVFDYYFERSVISNRAFVESSLAASDRVQQEDVAVCESVQRGLRSSAYDRGRYAPTLEQAAHRFHCLLAEDLRNSPPPASQR
jgi:choline monooxygenase